MKALLLLALFSAGQDGNFLPRKVGTTWTYLSGGTQVVQKIVAVRGNVVQIKTIRGVRGAQSVWFKDQADGLVMTRMTIDGRTVSLKPKAPYVLKTRVPVGTTWTAQIPYGKGAYVKYRYKRAANQQFVFQGKRHSAIRIDFEGRMLNGPTFRGHALYVVRMGLVYQAIGRRTMRLTGYRSP